MLDIAVEHNHSSGQKLPDDGKRHVDNSCATKNKTQNLKTFGRGELYQIKMESNHCRLPHDFQRHPDSRIHDSYNHIPCKKHRKNCKTAHWAKKGLLK